jgi:hypothetical protein
MARRRRSRKTSSSFSVYGNCSSDLIQRVLNEKGLTIEVELAAEGEEKAEIPILYGRGLEQREITSMVKRIEALEKEVETSRRTTIVQCAEFFIAVCKATSKLARRHGRWFALTMFGASMVGIGLYHWHKSHFLLKLLWFTILMVLIVAAIAGCHWAAEYLQRIAEIFREIKKRITNIRADRRLGRDQFRVRNGFGQLVPA